MARGVKRVLVWPELCRIGGRLYKAGDVVALSGVAEVEDLERRTRCRFATKKEYSGGGDLAGLAVREAQ